jgi:hypothetical protein
VTRALEVNSFQRYQLSSRDGLERLRWRHLLKKIEFNAVSLSVIMLKGVFLEDILAKLKRSTEPR